MPKDKRFSVKEDGIIEPYQLVHIADNIKGIKQSKKWWLSSCVGRVQTQNYLDRKNIDSV